MMLLLESVSKQKFFDGEADSQQEVIEKAIEQEVFLYGINFIGWDFGEVDLKGEPLDYCILKGANIDNIKGYAQSTVILMEIIRRQKNSFFTDVEWSAIGKVYALDLCYKSLYKHAPDLESVLKKVSGLGWPEYLEEYNKGK